MPNNYFQFKQFTVQQERAALKVSTDSCLLGAYCSNWLANKNQEAKHILDIGAGTALLMLMMAQKTTAVIDGIEIDEPSYLQAKENIDASCWSGKLNLFHADVKQFSFVKEYDFIISNPPFYEGDLKSSAANKNVAKHDEGLKLDDLLELVNKHLAPDGDFAVLLPYHRSEKFIHESVKFGLFLYESINIRQTTSRSFFRSILIFGKKEQEAVLKEMSIKNEDGSYTNLFIELLKDYYLYL
jgi:tRNA1Val (adenine37-N6)-methyltransferase